MSRTITLELPDDIYLALQRMAEKRGKNISQIVLELIKNMLAEDQLLQAIPTN
ncbi:MAG: Ribbon-helix-helix protein, copG family [Candidatus Electronema aureum]|uniref:Ribbon-helix-helix protein, copG family n=1 Tax=Candidatus Electronema aureum TaxID=2005002 RepID=A0A521G074_9BACT|nr:MAG: Ribbon-helix-helix protein, copG family [Candidatus Electronema aureum]